MYSPLHSTGIGLSDGEVMDRMWSILRRFSRMTKEMRPAHRVDILTHALLYYGLGVKYNYVRTTTLHVAIVLSFKPTKILLLLFSKTTQQSLD